MSRPKTPKALYVVISDHENPHANAPIDVFTTKRKAQRNARWGDQRIVTYVPQQSPIRNRQVDG